MIYYSQSKQDYIIDILLNGQVNGFFVDIGAHDGIFLSNSCFFEKERFWDGICFEPSPEVFERLKKNRRCKLVNGAVAGQTGYLNFTDITGYAEMLSGLTEYRNIEHKTRTTKEINKHGGNVQIIKVNCFTLDAVLSKQNIVNIDYLSLDIEGGELEVLESINFEKYNISILTIENNYDCQKIRYLMRRNGYYLLFSYGEDDYYLRRNIIFYLKQVLMNKTIFKIFINYRIKNIKNFFRLYESIF